MKINIKSLSPDELVRFTEGLDQKPFRARQLSHWLYDRNALSFDEMSNLPAEFRRVLSDTAFISSLDLIETANSSDGTVKFLFGLSDGNTIESVLIPNSRGDTGYTLCISSQAGCESGCRFCTTGSHGFSRDLASDEISNQVQAARRYLAESSGTNTPVISNIVFMGMGEPLNNFGHVSRALITLTDLLGFSRRKITVSTCGIIPGIKKLAVTRPRVNLAVSLNATTDEIRTRIMPVNRKYPLKALLDACRKFPLQPHRMITFEYVLLAGVNDSNEDAMRLPRILKGIRCKINLINLNAGKAHMTFQPSSEFRVGAFRDILMRSGLTAIVRKSMGADISAACGQLKAESAFKNAKSIL